MTGPRAGQPVDTTLPITGKTGVTRTDPVAVDVDTKSISVSVDIAMLAADPSIRIALSIEFSKDGGRTWVREGTSTHSGGRQRHEISFDGKKTWAPWDFIVPKAAFDLRPMLDVFGVVMREPGFEIGKDGKPLTEYSLERPIIDTLLGAPMFQGVVESFTGPITTTINARKR